jgi:hypothetical protein
MAIWYILWILWSFGILYSGFGKKNLATLSPTRFLFKLHEFKTYIEIWATSVIFKNKSSDVRKFTQSGHPAYLSVPVPTTKPTWQ